MAGRVLSKANEAKLRSATEALAAILALLDKEEESESKEAAAFDTRLTEAANLGAWLEARFHLAIVETVDYLYGDGKLTADERTVLLTAVDLAMDQFSSVMAENLPDLYQREPFADAPVESGDMQEAATLEIDFVPLVEQAMRVDGTILAKLIEPGWGSSGYYPREVLQRDGPTVFVAGTKQFWNHATTTEEAQRPEGDLNALAAELISAARWQDGPAGEGLYADAKVFTPYQQAINELAPHIGVSIRATGRAVQGEAEGRKGPIITALTAAKSVDFVTEAGAGGQIVEMFEAARARAERAPSAQSLPNQEVSVNEKEFKEAIGRVEAENARLRESLIARESKELVREALGKTGLPVVTQTRLLVRLAANPPIVEGALDADALLERVQTEVAEETQYLNSVRDYGSGRVEGMGQSAPPTTATQEALTKRMAESFQALGLSEASAAQAANSGW